MKTMDGWLSVNCTARLLPWVVLLLLTTMTQAQYQCSTNAGEITITKYAGAGGYVIIPDKINGLPVTSIGEYAFDSCTNLTRVTILDGVTNIGYGVFANCTSLTSVTIPGSVISIDSVFSVFWECTSLSNITVDLANTFYSSTNGVLFDKSQTTLITYPRGIVGSYAIPAGTTNVEYDAFVGCSSLTSVTFPSSVTRIGGQAFGGCSSLTSITIPAGVSRIEWAAFTGCGSLTNVVIPDGVTSIGVGAFNYCTSLTNVTIPWSVTNIDANPFPGCSSLAIIAVDTNNSSYRSVDGVLFNINLTTLIQYPGFKAGSYTIPNSVISIGVGAFNGCYSLGSITIPSSVSSIGMQAFWGCSSLTNVNIGNSVISIGNEAFLNCDNLTALSVDGVFFNKSLTTLIQYPRGKAGIYTIPSSVTSIVDRAFENCISLTSVTIPTGVTRIEFATFSGCSSLTNVVIPDGVTSIGAWAFNGCTSLTSVTIPWSVTSIESGPFSGCSSLAIITVNALNLDYKSVSGILFNKNRTTLIQYPGGKAGSYTIPSSVISIEGGAFNGCHSLTSVTIPAGVTNIWNWEFTGCSSLMSITVNTNNSSYRSVDGVLFNKNLTRFIKYPGGRAGSYTIPDSVASIGDAAFYACADLTSVTIPNSVTSIRGSAFSGCTSLASVTIPAGVTSIGPYAFAMCNSLRRVAIPSSVIGIIGEGTFCYCYNLTSVTIGEGITTIGYRAFDSCYNLKKVTIGSNVASIDERAFDYCYSLSGVYSKGKAPGLGVDVFRGADNLIVYYILGKKGWTNPWNGLPTALWDPAATKIIGMNGTLTFGNVITGLTATAKLTIINSGNASLTISSITYPEGFSGAWSGSIPAGMSKKVTVTFAPIDTKAYNGAVRIISDKTTGESTINASGAGVPPPGQICFGASSYSAQEGTTIKLFVNRINGADGVVSVAYVTKPKTALAWQDYTPLSGTLTWTNGQTASKTIKVKILADGKAEGNEVFQVLLKNPVGATLATPYRSNITILSNSKDSRESEDVTSIRMAKLTDALDGEGLTWFTSTLSPWTKQSFVTVDKVDAAISGQTDLDRVSWLQTELEGPGTLEYDWLVKGMGLDACLLIVDGRVYRTLGPGHTWTHEAIPLEEGSHTIRWVFTGESCLIPGSAYMDQVKWVPSEMVP